ncbi:MAG: efflux RND transporter periplasmic adaptor subunit [Candidatus Methylacidiphilales bacterium]
MKQVITVLVVVFILGVAAYFGWNYWEGRKKELVDSKPKERTATVERRDIEINVEVAGDIEPLEQVEVKAEVSAKLKKIHVVLGQSVERDQILFELDDTELLTQLESSKLEIASARLNLEKSLSDHQRNTRMFEKELIPAREVANSLTDQQLAENAVERARKRLQNVEDQLAKTRVMAPISGMILQMPVVEGQVVVAAASVSSGTLLMRLADLSRLVIKTHINQIDVAKISSSMPLNFFVDPLPGELFKGKIHSIAPTATVKQNVKGFEVDMVITDPDPRLRPGMTANVVIPIEKREQVLVVPLAAVFSEPDRSKVVFLPGAESTVAPEKRAVQIGAANMDVVEILSGLKEGEKVLLSRPRDKKT